LLEHGANPNLPNIGAITRTQIGGVTPLMAAAGLDSRPTDTRGVFDMPDTQPRAMEALRVLLAGGAEISAGDDHGRTALHAAASWGWTEVATFLVDNGADLFAADSDGATPLDAALGRMRGGRLVGSSPVHEDTAAALRELMAKHTERVGSTGRGGL
jgi:ankyrin repeat protein